MSHLENYLNENAQYIYCPMVWGVYPEVLKALRNKFWRLSLGDSQKLLFKKISKLKQKNCFWEFSLKRENEIKTFFCFWTGVLWIDPSHDRLKKIFQKIMFSNGKIKFLNCQVGRWAKVCQNHAVFYTKTSPQAKRHKPSQTLISISILIHVIKKIITSSQAW